MSELDDATVEAIRQDALDGPGHRLTYLAVLRLAPIFAKHLPDPRPTEAEALDRLSQHGPPVWPMHVLALDALRDLGCFRPEPAAPSPERVIEMADAQFRRAAEPVPAAEPADG